MAAFTAIVTSAGEQLMGDGVPVGFTITDLGGATPGLVGVTSPGVTGEAEPCTLSCDQPIVAQTGDAISCIKYAVTEIGATIEITASVSTGGGTDSDTASYTLPAPPTPTPTATVAPTATP